MGQWGIGEQSLNELPTECWLDAESFCALHRSSDASPTSGWSVVGLILFLPLGRFVLVQLRMLLTFLTDPSRSRLLSNASPPRDGPPQCWSAPLGLGLCSTADSDANQISTFLNTLLLCLNFSSLLFRATLHDSGFAVWEWDSGSIWSGQGIHSAEMADKMGSHCCSHLPQKQKALLTPGTSFHLPFKVFIFIF